jgi:hypothetical protein
MVFDGEGHDTTPGPALFFMGSDDGHVGLKFPSEEDAFKWIDDAKYADFELLFLASSQGEITKLFFHN